jgi:hypothetical protein
VLATADRFKDDLHNPALVAVELPQSGRYTLRVTAFLTLDIGEYALELALDADAPEAGPSAPSPTDRPTP